MPLKHNLLNYVHIVIVSEILVKKIATLNGEKFDYGAWHTGDKLHKIQSASQQYHNKYKLLYWYCRDAD